MKQRSEVMTTAFDLLTKGGSLAFTGDVEKLRNLYDQSDPTLQEKSHAFTSHWVHRVDNIKKYAKKERLRQRIEELENKAKEPVTQQTMLDLKEQLYSTALDYNTLRYEKNCYTVRNLVGSCFISSAVMLCMYSKLLLRFIANVEVDYKGIVANSKKGIVIFQYDLADYALQPGNQDLRNVAKFMENARKYLIRQFANYDVYESLSKKIMGHTERIGFSGGNALAFFVAMIHSKGDTDCKIRIFHNGKYWVLHDINTRTKRQTVIIDEYRKEKDDLMTIINQKSLLHPGYRLCGVLLSDGIHATVLSFCDQYWTICDPNKPRCTYIMPDKWLRIDLVYSNDPSA